MERVVHWLLENDKVDARGVNLLHVAFDQVPYDKFALLTPDDIELWLRSVAPSKTFPHAELGYQLRMGVVGRTITVLVYRGEILSGLTELNQQVASLDANGVLALQTTPDSPLARLQHALREGKLVTAPFAENEARAHGDMSRNRQIFGEVAHSSPGNLRTFHTGGLGWPQRY